MPLESLKYVAMAGQSFHPPDSYMVIQGEQLILAGSD